MDSIPGEEEKVVRRWRYNDGAYEEEQEDDLDRLHLESIVKR